MNNMRKRVLQVTVLFVLGGVGIPAQASAILELTPDNPGPYFGGESLTVDVWLHNTDDVHHLLYHVQLDFTDTHAELMLGPTFDFDLRSSTAPEDFMIRPDLPVPWTQNWLEYDCDECRLQLPPNASLHLGNVPVVLPTAPGTFLLDALNGDDPPHGGGWMDEPGALVVVDACYIWRAYNGDITGGVYHFEVVPEPVTLSMLLGGAVAMACRRRRRR